jgi:hypothetical protein
MEAGPMMQVQRKTYELVFIHVDGVFWYTKMFITLWFEFDYGTNPPLGTLII